MGPLGVQEMIFIFVAALVIFGPKKLPELGKQLGKGMAEFKRASSELRGTFQREMDNIERESRMQEVRQAASSIKSDIQKDFSPSSLLSGDGIDDGYYDEYDQSGSSTTHTDSSAARSDTAAEKQSVASTADANSPVESGVDKGAA
jgi:TatA/E family protein of Tat protein translocase